jgi:hypothetical protein
MKIKDLKQFIDSLPENFSDFDIVIRSFGTEADGNTYMYDLPVISGFIDEENNELCLLDEEHTETYKKLNEDDPDDNQEETI